MKPTPGPCAEEVRDSGMWPRWTPCKRGGVLFENDKWWCKQHAPSSVAMRRKNTRERWDAEQKAREEKRDREHENALCGDACRAIGDAQKLAAQIPAMVELIKEMMSTPINSWDERVVELFQDSIRALLASAGIEWRETK